MKRSPQPKRRLVLLIAGALAFCVAVALLLVEQRRAQQRARQQAAQQALDEAFQAGERAQRELREAIETRR
jgi:hypothetical protein